MRPVPIASPWHRLFLFIGLTLLFSVLFAFLGLLIGRWYLDVDLMQLAVMVADPQTPEQVNFLRWYQLLNQIGVFFLPVLGLTFFTQSHPWRWLWLEQRPYTIAIIIPVLLIFTVLPFNGWLTQINEAVHFPQWLSGMEQWMQEKEAQAAALTEAMLSGSGLTTLLFNMVVVALMPALGEEFFFRGVLLKLFREITGNLHAAVWISAFLFSAFHLQFYGFLPRLVMGLLLGYAMVFSRNLWVPVIMHFINNATSVILYYGHEQGWFKVPMDKFGTTDNVVYIIGSFMMTTWLLIMLYQRLGTDRYIKNL